MQELEEDKQQARLATAIIPFGEQRGTLINEKKSSVSSVQDVPEPPRQPLQFFAAFGSRRRIPAADVQKPCKYFDPDPCSQLSGLPRGVVPGLCEGGIRPGWVNPLVSQRASPCALTLYLRSGGTSACPPGTVPCFPCLVKGYG